MGRRQHFSKHQALSVEKTSLRRHLLAMSFESLNFARVCVCVLTHSQSESRHPRHVHQDVNNRCNVYVLVFSFPHLSYHFHEMVYEICLYILDGACVLPTISSHFFFLKKRFINEGALAICTSLSRTSTLDCRISSNSEEKNHRGAQPTPLVQGCTHNIFMHRTTKV